MSTLVVTRLSSVELAANSIRRASRSTPIRGERLPAGRYNRRDLPESTQSGRYRSNFAPNLRELRESVSSF